MSVKRPVPTLTDRLNDAMYAAGVFSPEDMAAHRREMQPLVVCYGGGVNSLAMVIGLRRVIKMRPDLIIFADTKAEKPETYRAIEQADRWLRSVDYPTITVVSNDTSVDASLEAAVLKLKTLPSIAFGFKTCSQRWKMAPQDKYIQSFLGGVKAWKAIGYDAGEPHRIRDIDDPRYDLWYPLVGWGWSRRECVEAITIEGLCVPPKSSCFYCPSSKKSEVLWLRDHHPDLFARAVEMERNAAPTLGTVRGLGRHWSWEEIARADEQQFRMFRDVIQEVPCMCFDGDDGEDEV